MHRLLAIVWLVLLLVLPSALVPTGSAQEAVSCATYDAWEWAQTVFESDIQRYAALDPDGDGLACPELPRGGYAAAFWTTTIPVGATEAEILRILAGDTLEVRIDGATRVVRLYRADAPDPGDAASCGAQEAMDGAGTVLAFNDHPVVYIEWDVRKQDEFGNHLAYVWFEVDGQPYLLNHILLTNGWADDRDSVDDRYDEQLREAAAFAERHQLGLWALCGGFGRPAPVPTPFDPTVPQDRG